MSLEPVLRLPSAKAFGGMGWAELSWLKLWNSPVVLPPPTAPPRPSEPEEGMQGRWTSVGPRAPDGCLGILISMLFSSSRWEMRSDCGNGDEGVVLCRGRAVFSGVPARTVQLHPQRTRVISEQKQSAALPPSGGKGREGFSLSCNSHWKTSFCVPSRSYISLFSVGGWVPSACSFVLD